MALHVRSAERAEMLADGSVRCRQPRCQTRSPMGSSWSQNRHRRGFGLGRKTSVRSALGHLALQATGRGCGSGSTPAPNCRPSPTLALSDALPCASIGGAQLPTKESR